MPNLVISSTIHLKNFSRTLTLFKNLCVASQTFDIIKQLKDLNFQFWHSDKWRDEQNMDGQMDKKNDLIQLQLGTWISDG